MCLENIPCSLQTLITSRQKQRVNFADREVIRMLHSVVNALIYLQAQNIMHQMIQPSTILFEESTNRFLLTDIRFLSRGQSEYSLILEGNIPTTSFFLSPELLTALKHRERNPQVDIEKS